MAPHMLKTCGMDLMRGSAYAQGMRTRYSMAPHMLKTWGMDLMRGSAYAQGMRTRYSMAPHMLKTCEVGMTNQNRIVYAELYFECLIRRFGGVPRGRR